MHRRLVLIILLLLTGLAVADDRSEYEELKLKISEQKRELSRFHGDRQYTEAMKSQKEIAELSRQALEVALKSPEIDNANAWNYHAKMMKEVGYFDEALEAVSKYLKTPLLKRNGFREGWSTRADIYKRRGDYEQAQKCYQKALQYADSPRERFQLAKQEANLYLKEAQPKKALDKIQDAEKLIPQIEEQHRLNAQRDVESILVKAYRDLDDATKARAAKYKVLELRRELLNAEIEKFNSEYPES